MSEKEFNEIFSRRLRYYLEKYDMTQAELAKRLGVGTTSVYNWANGIKNPRMPKVDAMCEIFHCTRSDLIEEPGEHYIDPETIALAQEIYENPELHMLLDAARGESAADIRNFYDMIQLMKRRERHED